MKRTILGIVLAMAFAITSLQAMERQDVWDGEQYARNSIVQLNAGMSLLKNITFQGNETVLDLGCGSCTLAAYMAQNVVPNGKVIAVDSSPSMIATAQAKYVDIPNLEIMCKDATNLDFNREIDVIVSVMYLHWIKDIEAMKQVMAGVARSLKPNGKFYAVFTLHDTSPYSNSLIDIGKRIIASERWAKYYENKMVLGNELNVTDYQRALDEAGLTGQAGVLVPPEISVSENQLIGFLSVIPFTQVVPQERKDDLFQELLKHFAHACNNDGLYVIKSPSGMIRAELLA